MFRAVLWQIIVDATCERVSPHGVKVGSGVGEGDGNEARRWCLSIQDRADRLEVLELAGIESAVFDKFVRAKILPVIERERAAPQRPETAAEQSKRLALLQHVALGGDSNKQRAGKKPKTAADWLTVAIATGDDMALARAAELELAEVAA
ncbi:MAG: hypothetical protein ACLQJR_09155 [Stellaceae bacterium]